MPLKIFDTLSKQKKDFKPLKKNKVRFYYCGPTVYKQQHIGGLRGNSMADLVRRSLIYLDFDVNFVSNYTDVGHLTSDEDQGEDKLEKQARSEKKPPQEIANQIIELYEQDSKKLNILSPTIRCRATDYISEMIEMTEVLLNKKIAYQTNFAIYFDTSKAEKYTQLSGQKIEEQISGAGTGDISDPQKKHPQDFALWFFKKGAHQNALQTWKSPWGEGFPGWHIECSAMIKKHLGDTIDIHMGGVEHIPVHHTNEIAQSELANGVKFSNYWLHNEHLGINETKMSKSLGNVVLVDDITKKGFSSLALRFFFLQAHYRSKQNFTWEALQASQNGLDNLYEQISGLKKPLLFKGKIDKKFKQEFISKIKDDFNIPQALSVAFEVLKSDLSDKEKLATILDFDKVLGLDLIQAENKVPKEIDLEDLPKDVQRIVKEREFARTSKNYDKSDMLRNELFKMGYEIKDSKDKQKVYKK